MPQDTGIYTCIAVNDHGSASSSASIKVQGLIPLPVGLWCRPFHCLWRSNCFVCPAGIPAAPGRPVAQEASTSAVMVHWEPPALSTHCAVSSYSVEYRQEGVCACVCVGGGGMWYFLQKRSTKLFPLSPCQTRCYGSRWPAAGRSAFRSMLSSLEDTTSSGCERPITGVSAHHLSHPIWWRCPALVSPKLGHTHPHRSSRWLINEDLPFCVQMPDLMEQEFIGKKTLSQCSQRSVRLEGRLLRIPQFCSKCIWPHFTLLSLPF